MDAKRLVELKTICDAATPGPWISDDEIGTPIMADQKTVISAMPICIPEERFTVRVKSVLEIDLEDEEFIITARIAMPELLAEVERLQHANRIVNEQLDRLADEFGVDHNHARGVGSFKAGSFKSRETCDEVNLQFPEYAEVERLQKAEAIVRDLANWEDPRSGLDYCKICGGRSCDDCVLRRAKDYVRGR